MTMVIKGLLTIDEILFSLEMLLNEFGADNTSEKVKENLSSLPSSDLSDDQLARIERLKLLCEI